MIAIKKHHDTATKEEKTSDKLVYSLFFSIACALSTILLLVIAQCLKDVFLNALLNDINILILIVLLVCIASAFFTDYLQTKAARLVGIILLVLTLFLQIITLAFGSHYSLLLPAFSLILLFIQWLYVLPILGKNQPDFFEPLPFLTAAILVGAEEFLSLPIGEIACIVLISYCILYFAYVLFTDKDRRFVCVISRKESRENLFEDITVCRRFISIFSWGLSAGVLFFLTFIILSNKPLAGIFISACFIITGWLASLLSHLKNANGIIPKISGAFIIFALVLLFIPDEATNIIGIILGFSFVLTLAFSLASALQKRAEICNISALWLFSKQMGFYFLGVLISYFLSMFFYNSFPDISLGVILAYGIVTIAMGQIAISESNFPQNPEVNLQEKESLSNDKSAECLPSEQSENMSAKSLSHSSHNGEVLHYVTERYNLSPRQKEIYALLAKGRNIPYIAQLLYVSESTVKTHTHHIYQKLGVNSQQELISQFDSLTSQIS